MLPTWIKNIFYLGQPIDPLWCPTGLSYMHIYTPSDLRKYISTVTPLQETFPLLGGTVDPLNVTGDLIIEFGMKIIDAAAMAPWYISLQLRKNDPPVYSPMIWCEWDDGMIQIFSLYTGAPPITIIDPFFAYANLKEMRFRITRTAGVIHAYYYNAGWVDSGYLDNCNDNIRTIDIVLKYVIAGFTYFAFEATTGLPYPTGAPQPLLSVFQSAPLTTTVSLPSPLTTQLSLHAPIYFPPH